MLAGPALATPDERTTCSSEPKHECTGQAVSILKHSAIYFSGSLLNKAIPFLLLPILTRELSPEEFGLIALLTAAVSLTSAIIGMNVKTNIAREYFDVDREVFLRSMTAIVLVPVGMYVIVQILLGVMVAIGWNPFGIPTGWTVVVPLLSLMSVITGIQLVMERIRERPWRYTAFEMSHAVLAAALTIYLVVHLHFGWQGQALSIAVFSVAFGIASLYWLAVDTGFSRVIDCAKIREVLRVSVPLFPHALASTVIVLSDRLFIDRMIGTDATGIYSVGYQFGAVALIFSQAGMKAWSPWFYRRMKNPTDDTRLEIVRLTYLALACIFALTIVYSALVKLVFPYLVDDRFLSGADYILWISLSCIAYAIYQWFFTYLVLVRRTSYLAFSSTVAMLANLAFNYFLIQRYGVIGAAYATFCAYAISAVLVLLAASRFVDMPWLSPWRAARDA